MTGDKFYIALVSVHGLIRGDRLELGRDADTGGQTLYVLELAQALARRTDVLRVDLFTRRVIDPSVDDDYANPIEAVSDKFNIVRIAAGPEEYIAKEQLWDHLDVLADNVVGYFHRLPRLPDVIHSHYADAGFVGARLANQLGIPLIHTGHSLGRVKRHRLLAGGLSTEQIEQRYRMMRRIEAEEETLATAERVITSTHQEIEVQYELYDHYLPEQMRVIPPGTNLEQFFPAVGDEVDTPLFKEITRSLIDPNKPIILALSRPDHRKNITALVEAYGQADELQRLANLVILAGNRDDIDELEEGAQEVFHELLVAIDRHDIYGNVAMPKHHDRDQVPLFYRIAAATGGVFVNPALTEPFGLTLIEAAASGLPIVATEDGGPRDIIGNCNNGCLIDPLDTESIAQALLKLLLDEGCWRQCAEQGLKGVREHYSWDAHAERYLSVIKPVIARSEVLKRTPIRPRKSTYRQSAIVSDFDQNLIGDEESLACLVSVLKENRKTTKFILATGRRFDSVLRLLKKHKIPEPDVLITSCGSEIYYAPKFVADIAWSQHIDYQWAPRKVKRILKDIAGLEMQPKSEQSRFKISYFYDSSSAPDIEQLNSLFHQEEQSVRLQLAFGQFLDVLPQRVSKGLALRYVADRWQIPLSRILVAGGSGADEDMMRGNTLAVVVANRHDEELSQLEEFEQVYFSEHAYSAGIMEALSHYRFFEL
ncbi:MAG: HAD-IIB family hydrolase [Gammaproteobacteria bacterium]